MNFILGLCVGSFLNVLADRLPNGEGIGGRSHCDWCKKTLRWWELVPVASYVVLRGRCSRCRKPLSVQYPLVELFTGIGFFLLPIPYWVLFCCLLVIFIADLKYQIIPDSMVVIGCLSVFLYRQPDFLSAAGAALFFFLIWALTKGRGMGFGDVKYAFLMGLALGYPGIVLALYIAFLTGAAIGVILILGRHGSWKSKIAFGPFLVIATAAVLLWQPELTALWHRYF